jgi:hypothetical protein
MRTAGGFVGATDISGDGTGSVEYSSYDDMDRAIRKMDGTDFKNSWDSSVITVRERGNGGGGGRGGSRGRSRSRSRRYKKQLGVAGYSRQNKTKNSVSQRRWRTK